MVGKTNNISNEVIRERLREACIDRVIGDKDSI